MEKTFTVTLQIALMIVSFMFTSNATAQGQDSPALTTTEIETATPVVRIPMSEIPDFLGNSTEGKEVYESRREENLKLIAGISGVTSAKFDAVTAEVIVTYNIGATEPEKIRSEVKLKFSASPSTDK